MRTHLPCPPLERWLPDRLSRGTTRVWTRGRVPRPLARLLAPWPRVDVEDALVPGLDNLVLVVPIRTAGHPPGPMASLVPGGQVVELAIAPRRLVRAVLGLTEVTRGDLRAAEQRAREWILRGFHDVEQWGCTEPEGVLLTMARSRDFSLTPPPVE